MYYNVLKSLKYRQNVFLNTKKKWFLNIILKNQYFFYNVYQYNRLKSNTTSISKIRIRCIINGKSRSVSSKYRLSRFFFKSYALKGGISGLKKL